MCCNSGGGSLCRNNAQLMSKLSLMHWNMLHIARNQAYLLKDALENYFDNLMIKYLFFAKRILKKLGLSFRLLGYCCARSHVTLFYETLPH